METDLAAGTEKTWRLYEGHAPAASTAGVEVKTTGDWYELTNGLTGIRVPRGVATDLAPVQGIRYRNGIWTASGPNYMVDAAEHRLAAKTFSARFIERGPLKTVVQLDYRYTRADLTSANKVLILGGAGYYRCTVTLEADQPSILLEDDTDMDLRYQFYVSSGLNPDQARYRGHHATSMDHGRTADGAVYGASGEPFREDAIRDLRFDPPAPSSYTYTDPYIRRMAVWDPWVFDSGWYWQLYDHAAGPTANLIGIFAGRASEALGAAHNGAGIFTGKDANGRPLTGIRVELNRRAPDARVFPRIRINWGIFIGIKGTDLREPVATQPIGLQMNLHGGINLNRIYRYPVGSELQAAARPLYMKAGAVSKMALRTRQDLAYYQHLYEAEPTARPLLDYWRDGSAGRRATIVAGISNLAHDLVEALSTVTAFTISVCTTGWAGLKWVVSAVWINAILSSPDATAAEKRAASAAAVLFASVLWDNDFVPLFARPRLEPRDGEHAGSANRVPGSLCPFPRGPAVDEGAGAWRPRKGSRRFTANR